MNRFSKASSFGFQLTNREEPRVVDWPRLIRSYEMFIGRTLRALNISGANNISLDISSVANLTLASDPNIWTALAGIGEGDLTG